MIQPSLSLPMLNDGGQEFYNTYYRWKSAYLRENPYSAPEEAPHCFLRWQPYAATGSPASATTSMLHGMGMLAVALAREDDSAREQFDGMVRFYKAFPSVKKSGLMAREILDDGEKLYTDPIDGDCATAGDMDIAYALALAFERWGAQEYLDEAARIARALAKHCIHQRFNYLKLGDWAGNASRFAAFGYDFGFCPSDFSASHMQLFYQLTGDGVWLSCIERGIDCLLQVQDENTGLFPDFCLYNPGSDSFSPAGAWYVNGQGDMHYSWNAAKLPLRLAGDIATQKAVAGTHELLEKLIAFFTAGEDVARIHSGYNRQTGAALSPHRGELCFISPLLPAALMTGKIDWAAKLAAYIQSVPESSCLSDTSRLLSLLFAAGMFTYPVLEGGQPGDPEKEAATERLYLLVQTALLIQAQGYTEESFTALQNAVAAAQLLLSEVQTAQTADIIFTADALDSAIQRLEEDVPPGYIPVASIKINASGLQDLSVKKTMTLTATVLPENATNKQVRWISTNTNIVAIDQSGLVTPKKQGTATITAQVEDKKSTVIFRVTA